MDHVFLMPGMGDEFGSLIRSTFGASEPGVWYRPDDATKQYTTELGVTQVAAVGDTAGLAVDQSRGGKVGPSLNTNPGGPFTATASWFAGAFSPTISVVDGRLRMTATSDNTARMVSEEAFRTRSQPQ